MSGSGDTELCAALITRTGGSEGGGEPARGASGTTEATGRQQHLDASIIYKTPAATKAKRDPNPENRIA